MIVLEFNRVGFWATRLLILLVRMCFRECISFRSGANDIYDVMVLLGTAGCLSPIRFIRNCLIRCWKPFLDVRLGVLVGGYLDRVGKASGARLRSVEPLEATVPR